MADRFAAIPNGSQSFSQYLTPPGSNGLPVTASGYDRSGNLLPKVYRTASGPVPRHSVERTSVGSISYVDTPVMAPQSSVQNLHALSGSLSVARPVPRSIRPSDSDSFSSTASKSRSTESKPKLALGVRSSAPSTVYSSPPIEFIDLNLFKGLKFINMDPNLSDYRQRFFDISGTKRWEICERQIDPCKQFIFEQCRGYRVFLICSGSQARRLISSIHDLPQIYAIYIFCGDVARHREWTQEFIKVRSVCNNVDYLIPQFAVDVARTNIELGDAFFKNRDTDSAKKKYLKALDNIEKYTQNQHDPMLEKEVRQKLQQCR